MSSTISVEGIKLPDDKWKKMAAAYKACEGADVEIPEEVENYFNGDAPDTDGVTVNLQDTGCLTRSTGSGYYSYSINIKKLPDGVEIVRFTNSW